MDYLVEEMNQLVKEDESAGCKYLGFTEPLVGAHQDV